MACCATTLECGGSSRNLTSNRNPAQEPGAALIATKLETNLAVGKTNFRAVLWRSFIVSTFYFLLSRESVFPPGIGGVAVAADFPIAGAILGGALDRLHELRTFPGVELRNNDAGRPAVLSPDRLSIELRGDEDVVVHAIFQANIGAVAIVAGEEDVFHFRFRPDEFGESEESDAAPAAIELAPGRDAVEVAHVFELRKRVEFLPGEGARKLDETADFEAPVIEGDLRADAEIEDGESAGEVLAGR